MTLIRFTVLAAALAIPRPALASCSTSDVCSDVTASLTGHLILDGVRLDWSTDSEPETTVYYRVMRYVGADPSEAVPVTGMMAAAGECDTEEPYSVTDLSGSMSYTYTLEVWAGNVRSCAVDTVPQ